METVKTIEDLKEGDVLTFGGKQHAYIRTYGGTFDFGDANGWLFSKDEVESFLSWGAITREEPKEITKVVHPRASRGRVQVPEAFANERNLDVIFRRRDP